RKKEELLGATGRLEGVMNMLGQTNWSGRLAQLQDRVRDDSFKVMVLGNFKTGKSTFINSLLHESVLPAYATPCTAVINEVKWSDEKRAIVHFSENIPTPLPGGLPDQVKQHVAAATGQVRPLEIPYEELESYVVIRDAAAEHEVSPYDKVELFWPLEFCRNGVEIIDSPGLNEHATREKVTTDYLAKADAVVFVLNSMQLAGQQEMQFFQDYVKGAGHESAFFICNRIDSVKPRKEQKRVKEYGYSRLEGETKLGRNGIFFTSAIDALEGREEEDEEQVEESGILEFEEALSRFLTEDRGSLKLLQPASELRRVCEEIQGNEIPERERLLDASVEDLTALFEALQPKLEKAIRTKDRIVKDISRSENDLEHKVERLAYELTRDLIDKIPEWAEGVETESQIKLTQFKYKEQANDLVEEVCAGLDSKIKRYIDHWRHERLSPVLEEHSEAVKKEIEYDIEEFFVNIDEMHSALQSMDGTIDHAREVSGTERLLTLVAGLGAADPMSLVSGG
ncbi:MAG: dynamin family protein, partial [Verrucomicrobiota bacterium]